MKRVGDIEEDGGQCRGWRTLKRVVIEGGQEAGVRQEMSEGQEDGGEQEGGGGKEREWGARGGG